MCQPFIDNMPSWFLLMNLGLTNDFWECLMLHCAVSFKSLLSNFESFVVVSKMEKFLQFFLDLPFLIFCALNYFFSFVG